MDIALYVYIVCVCVCVCVCLYVCVSVYIHRCVCVYKYRHIHICLIVRRGRSGLLPAKSCWCAYSIRVHVYVCVYACVRACVRVHVFACMRVHVCVCESVTYVCIHIYTRSHAHTLTYTGKGKRVFSRRPSYSGRTCPTQSGQI